MSTAVFCHVTQSHPRGPQSARWSTIFSVVLAALIGPNFSGAGESDQKKSSSARSEPTAQQAKEVKLTVTGWDGVQEAVAAQKGKVVLVDIWTTTCPTCVKRLPDFVALQQRYGADRVHCITVNCDYDGIPDKPPAYYRERTVDALQKSGAKSVQNLMLDISFLDFLELIDLSSTPAVLVYGQQGKLVRRFDNDDAESEEEEFTDQHVTRLLDRLIRAELRGNKPGKSGQ